MSDDMLREMWDMQTELNKKTFDSNSEYHTGCVDTDGDEIDYETLMEYGKDLKQQLATHGKLLISFFGSPSQVNVNKWIQQYTRAMQQECSELMDSTNWKWWREKVDKFDLQNIWVELIDIWHFLMSAMQVAGMTPEDLHKMYMEKNQVNFNRQESGYIEKDENDSRHLAPKEDKPRPTPEIKADYDEGIVDFKMPGE